VLMAAKPTPNVMPMKYLPSRVSFKRRGGRNHRLSLATNDRKRWRDVVTGTVGREPVRAARADSGAPAVGVIGSCVPGVAATAHFLR